MKRDDGLRPTLEELTSTKNNRLDELVDRDSLKEVMTPFVNLFGIYVRLFSSEGHWHADAV